MKKGEIYEGIIEKVDFPNKGYVMVEDQKVLVKTECLVRRSALLFRKNVQEELRAVFWRYWKNHLWKKESLYVLHFPSVEAACTRQCHMKSSFI